MTDDPDVEPVALADDAEPRQPVDDHGARHRPSPPSTCHRSVRPASPADHRTGAHRARSPTLQHRPRSTDPGPPRRPADRAWSGAARGSGLGPPRPRRSCWSGTGFLYLWGLGQSGWANSFYSAAVQAGTKSWKAFFFGSSDASNFITVDKPPASLWVMEISARLFGVNCLEHPGAPGARRGGHGRPALRHRPALVHTRCRAPGRCRARPHAGGHADVPVQQPRRPAHAAADRAPPTPRSGPSRPGAPGGWCWPARWSGSASSPRCSRP